MKSLTQEKRIIRLLLEEGEVSRNWCLQNYISRVSAIMLDLKKDGWKFTGSFNKKGDYIYKLTGEEQPLKLQAFYVQGQKVAEKIIAN